MLCVECNYSKLFIYCVILYKIIYILKMWDVRMFDLMKHKYVIKIIFFGWGEWGWSLRHEVSHMIEQPFCYIKNQWYAHSYFLKCFRICKIYLYHVYLIVIPENCFLLEWNILKGFILINSLVEIIKDIRICLCLFYISLRCVP